jgi:hypothetical protein
MAGIFERMLLEVDSFFVGASKVHDTLQRLARRLEELEIEFALAGGLAVGARGHLRLTVDIDVLITAAGLARFKEVWLGRGYVEKFPGSRGVKDAETGVSIDFLVSGGFPGDGRPKPVCFPDPAAIPRENDPYRVVDLRTLIELKLASGMSSPDRLVDLADVIALVRANGLSREFADRLDPSVQEKFRELWLAAQTKTEY